MKYEFHVGDYVETLEEKVGYIERIQPLSDGKTCLYIAFKDGCTYPYDMNEEGLKFRFKRIGQYDFTKKGKGKDKIKSLPKEYTISFPFYKTTTDGTSSDWLSINFGVVGEKINELVEAVNWLMENSNE